jgi:hypothetical protein
MKMRSWRLILVLALTTTAVFGFSASAAFADSSPANLGLDLDSDDDAGFWLGNLATRIRWFNQDVSIVGTPSVYPYESTSTVSLDYFGYSRDGSAFTSATASPLRTFSAQGIYSFEATGSNAIGTAYEASGSIGIDRTRPTSSSNLVPVYTGSAKITIRVADALSGPEFLLYTLDGASQRAVARAKIRFTSLAALPPVDLTAPFDVEVNVTTPGVHRLSWFVVDNAGNHERWHDTTFRVNALGYVPVLGRPTAHVRGHKAIFRGTVTPAARPRPVRLTVQRKGGNTWRAYATYTWRIPKYASTYSFRKTIKKDGIYRVKTTKGTGASRWSKEFTIE